MSAHAILQKYMLQELTIRNEMPERPGEPLQLKPEIRFQVFKQSEGKPIAAELTLEIGSMDDNSPLYIKVKMRGLFAVLSRGEDDRKPDAADLHRQALIILFNYARTLIAGATQMGGMAPFSLPPMNPDNINIQKQD